MRAFVASDDSSLSFALRDTLTRLGHDCPASQVVSLEAAAARATSPSGGARSEPESELLFVVLTPDVERALPVLRDLRRRTQQRIFAVGPATDSKLVLRTLRDGAHEYLDQADLSGELTAALERLKAERVAQHTTGRIVSVFPASGGSGCSTVAVNLAAALAKSAGSCILLDLVPEFGDLAPLLDLKPTYTLADLCRSATRLDRSLLEGALVAHSSGIRLLTAPARIADAGYVTADSLRRILTLATDLAPFVVADLPHSFRPEIIPTLTQADAILQVLRLDFTSLRNARRVLEYLQEAGLSLDRVRLVVNRHRQPGELPVADAEAALGGKIAHFIFDDPKAINRTNNNGSPIVVQTPSAKISGQFNAIAASLQQMPAAT